MTTPDPVTDVWELLLYAACDYRDANAQGRSESRLIDALMPIVAAYGDQRAAEAWDEAHATGWEHCRDGDYGNDYWDDDTPNPYRAAAEDPS